MGRRSHQQEVADGLVPAVGLDPLGPLGEADLPEEVAVLSEGRGWCVMEAAALSLAGDRTDARSPDPSSGRDQRGALCVRFTAGEFAPEPVNGALLSPSRETASCLLDEGFMLSSLPLPLFIRLRVREFVGPVSLSSSGTSAATLLFDDPMDGRGDSSALSEGAALSD